MKKWSNSSHKKGSVKGNARMWAAAAAHLSRNENARMWEDETHDRTEDCVYINSDLEVLGLSCFPENLRELQKARNSAMMIVHPDKGGTNEDAQKVQQAYENIKCRFE